MKMSRRLPLKLRLQILLNNLRWFNLKLNFEMWWYTKIYKKHLRLYICKKCGTILANVGLLTKDGKDEGLLFMHHGGYRCWCDFSKEHDWQNGGYCTKCKSHTIDYIKVTVATNDHLWGISDEEEDIPLSELEKVEEDIKHPKKCSCGDHLWYHGKGEYRCNHCELLKRQSEAIQES